MITASVRRRSSTAGNGRGKSCQTLQRISTSAQVRVCLFVCPVRNLFSRSLDYDGEKSPTATLVNPLSPGACSLTQISSRQCSTFEGRRLSSFSTLLRTGPDGMPGIPSVVPVPSFIESQASEFEQGNTDLSVSQRSLSSEGEGKLLPSVGFLVSE